MAYRGSSPISPRMNLRSPGPPGLEDDQEAFRTASPRAKMNTDESFDGPTFVNGAKRVTNFLYRLWRKGKMCDLVLVANGGVKIYAHKVVLAAYSKIMTDKFLSCQLGELVSLDFTQYQADIIMAVLYFVYTTEIEINDYTAAKIFSCAKQLGVEIIANICEQYLNNYDIHNVILFYSIAEQNGLIELRNRMYAFICDHFVEVSKTKHFCYVPGEKIARLLSDDNIVVKSELEVFFALVRWIDYERETRMPFAPTLMKCVRFHLIDPESLVTQVEPVGHIFAVFECHQILHEAFKYHSLDRRSSRLTGMFNFVQFGPRRIPGQPRTGDIESMTPPRTPNVASPIGPIKQEDSIRQRLFVNNPSTPPNQSFHNNQSTPRSMNPGSRLVTWRPNQNRDGTSTAATSGVTSAATSDYTDYDSYDTLAHSRSSLTQVTEDQAGEREDDLKIVAVGGIDLESPDTDTPGRMFIMYNQDEDEWQFFPPLPHYTHHHGAVVAGGKLFVIGGAIYDANLSGQLGHATNEVYLFNFRSATWFQAAPMRERRAHVGVAAYGSYIFAVGGEDRDRKHDSVEYYNVNSNIWSHLTRTRSGARIGCACAVHKGCLYIIGGFDNARERCSVLADVECLDIAKKRWLERNPLTVPRCHASLVVCKGRLYLLGGRTKRGPVSTLDAAVSLDTIEVLNETDGSWQPVGRLQTARHDAGCTAIGRYIYIVGGMQSPTPRSLTSVECFDVEVNRLVMPPVDLPYPATGLACCSASLAKPEG